MGTDRGPKTRTGSCHNGDPIRVRKRELVTGSRFENANQHGFENVNQYMYQYMYCVRLLGYCQGLFFVFERVMGSFVSGFCLLFPRFFTFDQNRPQTTVYCLLESVWNLPAANMAPKFHHDEEHHVDISLL